MSERSKQCPTCAYSIVFRGPLHDAEFNNPSGRAAQLYLRCPGCADFLVMESGKLGRVGPSLLAYEKWKIIPALGSLLTIFGLIATIVAAQFTSANHLGFRLSVIGMIGGIFLTSAFVVARGIHTGAAHAITKSLVPGRDHFRSFDPSLFWSTLVFWGIFLTGSALGLYFFAREWFVP